MTSPTSSDTRTARPDAVRQPGELSPGQVRMLKIAIVVLGVMIVVGVLAVIARIVYLSSERRQQGPVVTTGAAIDGRIALPAGATVQSMALDGARLAVHYNSPSGPGIAIVDAATGRLVTRLTIAPEPPR